MKPKTAVFVGGYILTVIVVIAALFGQPIKEKFFKKPEQVVGLNYAADDITYIEVYEGGYLKPLNQGLTTVRIDNPVEIAKILAYANSQKLVANEELNSVWVFPDLRENKHFGIVIHRKRDKSISHYDFIGFVGDIQYFISQGDDENTETYIVKNSGYNPLTENNNAARFLVPIIQKHLSDSTVQPIQ